jgi:outer membrane lipoprotein SlyB
MIGVGIREREELKRCVERYVYNTIKKRGNMKKIIMSLGFGIVLFTGCTQMYNSNEVALNDVNVMYTYKTGVVTNVKKVIIKDNESGVMSGAVIGTVLGSLFGKGKGSTVAALVGGLSGAYAGYKLDRANAKELYIKLDDGRDIVAIVKGVNIQKGERVRVVVKENRIIRVEKIKP